MDGLKEKLNYTIISAQKIISENNEWKEKYKEYASLMLKNTSKIEEISKNFHKWNPLKFYLRIGYIKYFSKTLPISVRYKGQAIATMKVSDKVLISTKDFDDNNKRDFNCMNELSNIEWKSKEASEFRKYFMTKPQRDINSPKKNDEHRVESMLIAEFSKTSSKDKLLCGIQPIKYMGFPFSMQTIISGSDKEIKPGNGNIDILARTKDKKIVVFELKDENRSEEPLEKVLQQATGYAVFLINLLRSDCGNDWYKLFEFGNDVPKKSITIKVCSAMPKKQTGENEIFEPFKINCGIDVLEYHWLYFDENGEEITNIETSLNK